MIDLDTWQKEVLETKGNIVLRSGRQVGKSTIISIKAGEFAIRTPKKTILVIASVERQASLLFEKTLAYLYENYKEQVKTGKDKPTRHKIQLKNGSVIHSLPTGLSGYGIRGYTIDLLIADEAAFIPEDVWTAVTPMLAVTKGTIILLSTPKGKGSYFYRCFSDPSFSKFHISSEECSRSDQKFLEREKKRMTKLQYAQEYLGEFLDELQQLFPTELVKEQMNLERNLERQSEFKYFLGVDIARYGGDQSTFVVLEKTSKDILNVKDCTISENMSTTHVIGSIKKLNEFWKFTKIYIDDGGIGAPILDILLEDDNCKRLVVGINNSKKSIEHEDKPRTRRILKDDLYANLLSLLQQKQLNLIKDPEMFRSLTSMQFEYTKEGRTKIFGDYSHITEGLIRGVWCIKDKSLNIYIF